MLVPRRRWGSVLWVASTLNETVSHPSWYSKAPRKIAGLHNESSKSDEVLPTNGPTDPDWWKNRSGLLANCRKRNRVKLEVGGQRVISGLVTKYLKVMIDTKLNFKEFLEYAHQKAPGSIAILSKILSSKITKTANSIGLAGTGLTNRMKTNWKTKLLREKDWI